MSARHLAFVSIVLLGVLNAWVDILHVRETSRVALTRPPPLDHYSE